MFFADFKYLLLLLVIPLLMVGLKNSSGFLGLSARRVFAIKILRSLAFLLLVFAIAELGLNSLLRQKTVVFVVDKSDSINKKSLQKAMDVVEKAVQKSKPEDKIGLVFFGSAARVESIPSTNKELTSLSVVDTKATNIEEALKSAITVFPLQTMKKIVLLSDGNSNHGDIDNALKLADLSDVEVDVMEVASLGANEVLALSLDMPGRTRLNERFTANAYIESDIKTRANVILTKQGQMVDSKAVALDVGVNKIDFSLLQTDTGFNDYEVRVEAQKDNFTQNNVARNTTLTEDTAKILYVSKHTDPNIKKVIESGKMEVQLIRPSQLGMANLNKYSAIVIENVPYAQIGHETAAKIERQVKNAGTGLVFVGGDRSYGPGGYANTLIEKALPVKMNVRSRKRSPSMAEVLVIDKSGSMGNCHCSGTSQNQGNRTSGGLNKVDISKAAALNASYALTSGDYFGVVATDKDAFWPHPLAKAGKLNPRVDSLVADGDTNVFQGIVLGYNGLMKLNASTKHMILITDGWTDLIKLSDFLSQLKKEKITLSIVAAGEGSTKELADIADSAGGRYYTMEDVSKIPEIVVNETNTALRPYINERLFFPKAASSNRVVASLNGKSWQLKGYVLTTLKSLAEQILVSDENDPVLLSWQYGLGRSIAWTSDGGYRWADAWVDKEKVQFWSTLVQHVLPQKSSRQISMNFVPREGEMSITAKIASRDPSTELQATVISPDGQKDQVQLRKEKTGEYSGVTQADGEGVYSVTLDVSKGGKHVLTEKSGFVKSYPSEYLHRTPNKFLLNKIAENTGGIFIRNHNDIFNRQFKSLYDKQNIWRQLVFLALLLFFTDIVLRKFTMNRQDLAEIKNDLITRMKRPDKTIRQERSPTMERLNRAKEKALKDK